VVNVVKFLKEIFLDKKLTVILISNVMSWAGTSPKSPKE